MSLPVPRKGRRWVRTAAIVVMAAAAMTTAQDASAAPAISTSGNYCAFNSATGKIACVEAEKDYNAAKVAAGVVGSAGFADGVQTQYLLGRFYDNDQFNTARGYIDWFAPAGCTASTTNVDSSWVDTTTWRSRISSFQGFSNCLNKVWENTGYTGASLGYTTSSANVGVLNDHIWSVRFT